jgi:multidrug transporter EmrE-like cation transporter
MMLLNDLINPALAFGLVMAFIDVLVLSGLQMRHSGTLEGNWIFPLAFIVYGCQSMIFYYALTYTNLTIMNLMWDLSSDIILTFVGLMIFKDKLTMKQMVGLGFAFPALLLLK